MNEQKQVATRFHHEDYIFRKIFGTRVLPLAPRTEYHIGVNIPKSWFFYIGGKIFSTRARGNARVPKLFLESNTL